METQERILEKAHELFLKFGIRSVSMDEIAAHLGISKKTIYHFFADKDHLVQGVLQIEISKTEEECVMQKQNRENAIHEIFLAQDMLQEMLQNFNPSHLYDLEKYHPRAFRQFKEHHDDYLYGVIKENLETGIKEELYRPNINTDILTRFRMGSMFMAFNTEYFPMGKYSLPTLIYEMTDNFLHGIVTPKGTELIQQYQLQRKININQ